MKYPEESKSNPVCIGKNILNIIEDKQVLSDRDKLRSTLEAFVEREAWDPFFATISQAIQIHTSNPFFLIELASYSSLRHQGNLEKCIEWSRKWLSKLKKPSLQLYLQNFVIRVVDSGDFASQAALLEDSLECFDIDDRIHGYEQLAYLYEKKLFKESELARIYHRLLAIDGSNIKALKYLKLAYSHDSLWNEVAAVLLKLIQRSTGHVESMSRYAHELATVYLYDLGDPVSSLETLEKWCKKTHLDTTVLRFDCHQTLSNWNECVEILSEIEAQKSLSPTQRAAVLYKKGCILEGMHKDQEAMICFREAISILPTFLECYEKMIHSLVTSRDLIGIQSLLKNVREICLGSGEQQEIDGLISRVEKAMNA